MKLFTVTLLLSSILFTLASDIDVDTDPCFEAFEMTDIALDDLNDIFVSNQMGMLSEGFGFLQSTSELVKISCIDEEEGDWEDAEVVEITEDDHPDMCSFLRSFIEKGLNDHITTNVTSLASKKDTFFIQQQILSLFPQINEYNCKEEWNRDFKDGEYGDDDDLWSFITA